MAYLIEQTDKYVLQTVEEVKQFQKELEKDKQYTISSFGYKTKVIKGKKDEPDEEYQLVTVKKKFNEEKYPNAIVNVYYEIEKEEYDFN